MHRASGRLLILVAAAGIFPQLAAASAADTVYLFCYSESADVYISNVFSGANTPRLVVDSQNAFKAFASQKYGKNLPWASCLPNSTEQFARDRKERLRAQYAQSLAARSGKVVDTGWTYDAAATSPPAARGPTVYTFCHAQSNGTNYMSDIFTASERDIANISGQYRQFVAQQYQLPLARISFACDNAHIASEAKASASKAADIKRMESDPAFPKTVETGWKGPGAPAPPAVAGAAPTYSGPQDPRLEQLPPDERTTIMNEASRSREYCETNATLMNGYDCACFARLMLAARLDQGVKIGYGPGGRRVLNPQFGVLVMKTNLKPCAKSK